MSEDQEPRQDLRAERWQQALKALAESQQVLVEARDGVQELQDELARASRWLEDVDWAQRGGEWPPAEDRRTLLRAFAEQCQAAAHQAEGRSPSRGRPADPHLGSARG